jgi:putative DNA primase/helicase
VEGSITSQSINSQNVRTALFYASRGWRVIPIFYIKDGGCSCEQYHCYSPGKHPMLNQWNHRATIREEVIKSWWGYEPLANVAIVTGKDSNIWSLDVDGSEGKETMRKLVQKHGDLPPTFYWETGGGGYQILFKYPEDIPMKNKVGIFPSVDVRGDDGYVLAPPSNHISGNPYVSYCDPYTPVADAPQWLLETASAPVAYDLVPGNGLLMRDGQRNSGLFMCGMRIKEEVTGLSYNAILDILLSINRFHTDIPLEREEVEGIAKSIYKR